MNSQGSSFLKRGKMILVFSEDDETALEILGKGREIADSLKTELGAIAFGNEENLIDSGADKIYTIDMEPSSEHIVEVISNLIDQYKPEILLIGGTKLGKEVAPWLAQISGVGCATDCIDCSIEERD